MCVPGAGVGEVPDGCWAKPIVETSNKLKSEKRNVASREQSADRARAAALSFRRLDAIEQPAVAGGAAASFAAGFEIAVQFVEELGAGHAAISDLLATASGSAVQPKIQCCYSHN